MAGHGVRGCLSLPCPQAGSPSSRGPGMHAPPLDALPAPSGSSSRERVISPQGPCSSPASAELSLLTSLLGGQAPYELQPRDPELCPFQWQAVLRVVRGCACAVHGLSVVARVTSHSLRSFSGSAERGHLVALLPRRPGQPRAIPLLPALLRIALPPPTAARWATAVPLSPPGSPK